MPLSRTDYKDAMKRLIDSGSAANKLVDSMRWHWLTMDETRARNVLQKAGRLGVEAQDVLDQMEENDE